MTLSAGTRLGPYEIVAPIGAGGMGEVYKARDTRLDREVAVKVLSAHLGANEELRQRFEREAKTISKFSHPHICALYDVGREGETDYLVMEYLEGESLADRLGKGSLPVDQVLRYGIEIADALDKAHRQGIVHRDLKPGNVMLTKTGVKLLDFGLAKPLATAGATPISGASVMATEAQASHPLTERGTILGTFQYMSPEQLEGGEADSRSDIFAFGAVLYEMATGKKAFTGKSQASLISSIMREEPSPISSIAPMVPPALNRVVRTCLAKDPEDRFQTAHDVKLQIEWVREGGSEAGLPAPVVARRKNREKIAWGVAALGIAAALALGFGFWRRTPQPKHTMRFDVGVPQDVVTVDMPRISPDGRILAFDATDTSGTSRIWIRPLNALQAHPLAGTDGTKRVFWSPDSRFLGFMANGKLMKIDVTGGPPQKICDAPTGSDGTWGPDGLILYDGTGSDPIMRVSATGGVPAILLKAEASRKETEIGWPVILPDGRHFLYMAVANRVADSTYRIASLDGKENRVFAPAQSAITYVEPGYLLYLRERTLVAQPFDAKTLKTTGEPIPLAENVGTDSVGLARFSVSREGTLVYRTGEINDRLVWVDRTGKELEVLGDPAQYHNPALSSDEKSLAFDEDDPRGGTNVWVRDLARGVNSRLTFAPSGAFLPVWSPDGKKLVYTVGNDLFEKAADGQGAETPVLKSDETKYAEDWSPDGRTLVLISRGKDTGWDLWTVPADGERKPTPWLKTPFLEVNAVFSPDGRFIAYQSNESGRFEVYVQSFPGPGGKWQVSTAGGLEPRWRSDGKEMFYRAADQKLMALDVQTGATFQAGIPKPLFPMRLDAGIARTHFLASKDGQRFLLVATPARESITPTTVVLNWMADLGK